MKIPQYDIFCGQTDKDALWLEAVEGLGMQALATQTPGAYFVFCQRTHEILASIDMSVSSKSKHA
jgi:hypothetical protein